MIMPRDWTLGTIISISKKGFKECSPRNKGFRVLTECFQNWTLSTVFTSHWLISQDSWSLRSQGCFSQQNSLWCKHHQKQLKDIRDDVQCSFPSKILKEIELFIDNSRSLLYVFVRKPIHGNRTNTWNIYIYIYR